MRKPLQKKRIMKFRWFSMLIVVIPFIANAQDTPQKQDSITTKTALVPKDSLAIEDGKTIDLIANDSIVMIDGQPTFEKKADNKYNLQDYAQAAKIDSLWLQELHNMATFDSIYKTVSNLTYTKVEYVDLPTDTLKARLKRLNARTPFNVEYNPSLESVIKNFLKNRHKSLTRLMTVAQYYFPMFEQELDNYDIPIEMKYLAIVESALNPRARSRVGATGLWQFMYATGRQYNLEVNSYVDERSDPMKATKAACEYLASLYKIFGDWDLALAAYNSGPGNVSKAIRRSGGYKNYWNLRPYLPRETAGYVPAFLATMYIFEYADQHAFQPKITETPYFKSDTIQVKKLITFDQISELIDIKVEELQFYNPSYKLDIIPNVEGRDYALRLPIDKIGVFVSNEEAIYAHVQAENDAREKPLPQLFKMDSKIRYRVRSGDYLGRIARKFGVRVSDIKRWNGLRNNNIRVGRRLTIYPKKPAFTNVAPKKSKKKVNPNAKVYVVQSGDSLWSISQKFNGVSVQNLKDWNDISGTKLKPGMKLKVSK